MVKFNLFVKLLVSLYLITVFFPGIDDNDLFLGAIEIIDPVEPTSPTSPPTDPESAVDNDREVVRQRMLNGCGCMNVNHFEPLTADL